MSSILSLWSYQQPSVISLVHGICYNLPRGDNAIDLRTYSVNSYMSVGAFNTTSRLYIDELSIRSTTYSSEPAVASCPGLSFFNTREFVTDGEFFLDPERELFVRRPQFSCFSIYCSQSVYLLYVHYLCLSACASVNFADRHRSL